MERHGRALAVRMVLAAAALQSPFQTSSAKAAQIQLEPSRPAAGYSLLVASELRFVAAPGNCPVSLATLTDSVDTTKIFWNKISSDRQAIVCVYALAKRLGQDSTRLWFRQAGFKADFIAQFPVSDGDVLLSTGWSIRRKGLLYRTGLLSSAYNYWFAYGFNFSMHWDRDGNLSVEYVYTYK